MLFYGCGSCGGGGGGHVLPQSLSPPHILSTRAWIRVKDAVFFLKSKRSVEGNNKTQPTC